MTHLFNFNHEVTSRGSNFSWFNHFLVYFLLLSDINRSYSFLLFFLLLFREDEFHSGFGSIALVCFNETDKEE